MSFGHSHQDLRPCLSKWAGRTLGIGELITHLGGPMSMNAVQAVGAAIGPVLIVPMTGMPTPAAQSPTVAAAGER